MDSWSPHHNVGNTNGPFIMDSQALIADFVAWVAREPRAYKTVIENWGGHCPRLTVWEDAYDQGFVRKDNLPDGGLMVRPTKDGLAFLAQSGRSPLASEPVTSG